MSHDARRRTFELHSFLPYMLNQVAEAVSKSFQERYQKEFGLTRTQWRILAHLYADDGLTAKEIGRRIHEDKVSISRAVAALDAEGRLSRSVGKVDRRFDLLNLTDAGRGLFELLSQRASAFEKDLSAQLGAERTHRLREVLAEVIPLLDRRPQGD